MCIPICTLCRARCEQYQEKKRKKTMRLDTDNTTKNRNGFVRGECLIFFPCDVTVCISILLATLMFIFVFIFVSLQFNHLHFNSNFPF